MNERYVLEIYIPGSKRDVLEAMSSDHPFLAISVGDFFNSQELSSNGMGRIRVTGVEHVLWNSAVGPKHKVCVYTEDTQAKSGKATIGTFSIG